jgi:anti-sigma B factor antagonist
MTVLPFKRRLSFRIEVTPDGDHVRVAPAGDLDMATAEPLWDEISRLRDRGFAKLVLDLRGLTFLDSSGLRLLVRAQEEVARDGAEFALVDGAPPVCRVLDITGLRNHFEFIRLPSYS